MQKKLAIIEQQSNDQFEHFLKDDKFSGLAFAQAANYWHHLTMAEQEKTRVMLVECTVDDEGCIDYTEGFTKVFFDSDNRYLVEVGDEYVGFRTLRLAKQFAATLAYSNPKRSINIYSFDTLYFRKWNTVMVGFDDCFDPIQIGDLGYYSDWEERFPIEYDAYVERLAKVR